MRIYQGRLVLLIHIHNVGQPCAYDFNWYDDGGDNADELNGVPREHTSYEILFLVGIWVSLFDFDFPSCLLTFYPRWQTVLRCRNGESGTRNGVRYRRKVISGGRGIDTQSGWMLWVFRGWDGFVSDPFHLFLLLYFLAYFYQHDPSFWRICWTLVFLFFFEMLGNGGVVQHLHWILEKVFWFTSRHLGRVWLITSNFWCFLIFNIRCPLKGSGLFLSTYFRCWNAFD